MCTYSFRLRKDSCRTVVTGVRTPRNVLYVETNETQCPTCHHGVSAAHVPGSYTCNRAAGMAPEESDR